MAERDWRAIDSLLAEHLFGWREIVTGESGYLVGLHPRKITYGMTPHETIPFYSSAWAGVGEVVNAMTPLGWILVLRILRDDHALAEFRGRTESHSALADTAPRAVVLAAIRCLGLEVPSDG